jgi:hypothetical protein
VERRKLIGGMVPYLLDAYSAYASATSPFSPSGLIARAAGASPGALASRSLDRDDPGLQSEVKKLDLRTLAPGIFSFQITREQLMDLAEDHLRAVFAPQGGKHSRFIRADATNAVLVLPSKSIHVALATEADPKEGEEKVFRDQAERRNPSETWVITMSGREVSERLPPKSLTEERAIQGQFRMVPVAAFIGECFGARYDVVAVGRSGEMIVATLRKRPS